MKLGPAARWIGVRLAAAAVLTPAPAYAHGIGASVLTLQEGSGGIVQAFWKTTADPETQLQAPKLPRIDPGCRPLDAGSAEAEASPVLHWSVDCGPGGLRGHQIVAESATERVFVLVLFADGSRQTTVIEPDQGQWTVPSAPSAARAAGAYLRLGVEHILGGADHLLFVLGLIALVGVRRRLAVAVTAFTAAHSVTLGLTTLDVIRLPSLAVEAVVALSIMLLATELTNAVRSRPPGLRRVWVAAFAFGLLHGCAFAEGLRAFGLPDDGLLAALLSFNIGVELGQLAVVAAVAGLVAMARRTGERLERCRLPLAYGMGALASFWVIERLSAFWAA